MQQIPEDVVFRIFEHIRSSQTISAFNLACKGFARIGQRRHFANITLKDKQDAETLAALAEQNGELLSLVVALDISDNTHASISGWHQLWSWLLTEHGTWMLGSMSHVERLCLHMKSVAIHSMDDEELLLRAIKNLANVMQIHTLTLWDIEFSDPATLSAFVDLFRTVRSLELDYTLEYSTDDVPQKPKEAINPIAWESLSFWNCHVNLSHFDTIRFFNTAGRLKSLRSLTIHCLEPEGVIELAEISACFASTLRRLAIHISQSHHFNEQDVPTTVFPSMEYLEVLRLSGFTDGLSAWLVARMKPIVPRDRSIDRMILYPSIQVLGPDHELSPLSNLDEFAMCAQRVDLTIHLKYDTIEVPVPDTAETARMLVPLNVARGALNLRGIRVTSRRQYWSRARYTDSDNDVTTDSDDEGSEV